MIAVLGPEHTTESAAAEHLQELIGTAWPSVAKSNQHSVQIVGSAKCYGQKRKDIDILVFANLGNPFSIGTFNQKQISIQSFCLTIEVKSHAPQDIQFEGNKVYVKYKNGWEDASEQSEEQQVSLRSYLASLNLKAPYVTNLIWLLHVPESEIPQGNHNIIGSDATWEAFLHRIWSLRRSYLESKGQFVIRDQTNDLIRATEVFTKKLTPSRLDRRKMEIISQKALRDQQYKEKIGRQLLIYRGRGGTGKTVQLLRVAHDLYREMDAKVLILTYNKALVSDIRRVLALMNISDDIARPSIIIQTVHQFLYSLFERLRIIPSPCLDFLAQYEQYKAEALELVGAAQPKEIEHWDYVFIDEAQDWPTDERDILFAVYDYRQFVLADGVDQLVRTQKHIDWRERVERKDTQVISLRKGLRLKEGLCVFAQTFARHLGLGEWNIEPDQNVHGGRVVILEGLYAEDRTLHDSILGRHLADGNAPVDMLFCVPPDLVRPDKKYSYVGKKLRQWDFAVWDGVDPQARESYPTSLEQVRIVQYDSCRGLEGWTVVSLGFDKLYDYKLRKYEPKAEEVGQLFFDREKAAHNFAATWLMIPLTRAIDTLVIQLSHEDHYVKDVLREVAKECGGIVEWRKVEAT
ncbi:MAG TPA: DNA/RNA helicase domain-containing protein [Sphingobacteriaceae bacterium]